MQEIDCSSVLLVIYGAGALGCATAVDRMNNKSLPPVHSVLYCVALHHFKTLDFVSPSLELEEHIEIQTLTPPELFEKLKTQTDSKIDSKKLPKTQSKQDLEIIFTVPPQALDEAIHALIQNLKEFHQNFLKIKLNIMSNGAVSEVHLTQLLNLTADFEGFNIVRSLVVAGFMAWRENHTPTHLHVKHTGGQRVYWNEIGLRKEPQHHPFHHSRIFQAIQALNIRELEFQKVFTNAVLGLVIRERLLPNSELSSLISTAQVDELALEFINLFPDAGDKHSLAKFLWQTVSETSTNVNSVSLSWSKGNPDLAVYFAQLIARKIKLNVTQLSICPDYRHWLELIEVK